ncbi:alpha/beta hydrolase [Streptomyces goshikiensis]|uniref:alpha/beta hydrolase n=1 Tax=Streptomyces goshikiensis TaxID=1942 RepID=UPI0036CE750A
MFSGLSYPDTAPDTTATYAGPDGRPLKADLYLPKKASGRSPGAAPAIVLAHSGGFHTFDKSDLRGTGRWLADHGAAVVAVDYRLTSPGRPT